MFRVVLIFSAIVLFSGCSNFPPAYKYSNTSEKENLIIEKMTCLQIDEYTEKGKAANIENDNQDAPKKFSLFGSNTLAAPVAPIIAAAAGYAIDYAKDKVKDEAKKYTQQYHIKQYSNDLISADACYGLKLTRKITDADEDVNASEIIVKFYQSNSGNIYFASPYSIKTTHAKAKVVDWPWTRKNRIDIKIELSIDAAWVDDKNSYHKETLLAADPFVISKYNIKKPRYLFVKNEARMPFAIPKNASDFWINILVTENDSSKTKKYLLSFGDLIDKNKDKVIDKIKSSDDKTDDSKTKSP